MAQIDTLTNVGAVVSTDLALILRGGANVLGTLGSLVGQNSTAVSITGGTINGTVIGGSTPAAVTTTALVATTADINGGTIDGVTIGGASAGAGTFTTLGASSTATFSAGAAGTPAITTTGDTNTGIYFPAADTVALTTAGTGRFFVNASGNVIVNDTDSISTNATGYFTIRQENVAGETSLAIINASNSDADATVKIKAGQASRNGGEIVFGKDNAANWATTTNADGYIAFAPVLNNANTERLRILSNGDFQLYEDTGTTAKLFWDASAESLGIGTSSPATTLHVNSTSGIRLTSSEAAFFDMYGGAGNSKAIRFYGGSDTEAYAIVRAISSNGGLGFETGVGGSTAASEAMRINSSGHLIVPEGITLGTAVGTYAAANTLDDYEEGIYTVVVTPLTSGSITLNSNIEDIAYTKVGQLVTITGNVTVLSVSSPVGIYVDISLPFAISEKADQAERFGSSFTFYDHSVDTFSVVPMQGITGSVVRMYRDAATWAADDQVYFSFSYTTDL